jgi:hypothetical protein
VIRKKPALGLDPRVETAFRKDLGNFGDRRRAVEGDVEVDILDRAGTFEQITLQRRYAGQSQQLILLPRFHTLGRHRDTEIVGKRERRRNDRDVFGALRQILSKRFANLDLVGRKHRQLAQRRVTGAEIVQRDGDAGIFEAVQCRADIPTPTRSVPFR